jgi:hypothetical protein
MTLSPVTQDLCGAAHGRVGCCERSCDQLQEAAMKGFSNRQARRWVIQELTRRLEQRREPLPLTKPAED